MQQYTTSLAQRAADIGTDVFDYWIGDNVAAYAE
jgi:hypothetical protein